MIDIKKLSKQEFEMILNDVERSNLDSLTTQVVLNIIREYMERNTQSVDLTDVPPLDDVKLN